jgi:four helix bundle protein
MAARTREFAVAVIRLYTELPRTAEAQVVGRQMLRSGTAVGAHYREGRRSRSDAEFVSKVETALQELEETRYWLELLQHAGIVAPEGLVHLDREADELTAILVTIAKKRKRTRMKDEG